MSKQDRSILFDAKMELHPEEESFAEPTISANQDRKRQLRWDILLKVGLVVLLVIAAFIGGYLVRRAVHKSKCKDDNTGSNRPMNDDNKVLQDMLATMSPSSLENMLRFV